jgi:hypothetical protein
MRFCEIGTCREHGLCRRAREGDPSVYVGAKGAVCCTVVECATNVLSLVVDWLRLDGWLALSGVPCRVCRRGCVAL